MKKKRGGGFGKYFRLITMVESHNHSEELIAISMVNLTILTLTRKQKPTNIVT